MLSHDHVLVLKKRCNFTSSEPLRPSRDSLERDREGGKEGRREIGREGRREIGREGRREIGREGRREGREMSIGCSLKAEGPF